MPKVSLADSVDDWDKLLATAGAFADDIPGLKRFLVQLKRVRDRTLKLEARRLHLQAESQVVTQELRGQKDKGKDLAISIRWELKAALGHTHPRLVEFGVKPRRSRRSKKLAAPVLPAVARKLKDPPLK